MATRYPRFYRLENWLPVRELSDDRLPEVYRGNGEWEFYVDPQAMAEEAVSVSEDEFEELLREYDLKHA